MGGLKPKLPITAATFMTATLAIAGIVPLAGFFSKDEILWGAWSSGNVLVWGVLALSAGLTAFYMFRLNFLVFYGDYRGDHHTFDHAHESPKAMTVPLMILAALSVAGGWIGIPKVAALGYDINVFEHWLAPALATAHGEAAEGGHAEAGLEGALMVVALMIAVAGIAVAWLIYRKREGMAESIARRFRPVYVMWRNLYWVDELYEALILKPFYAISRFFAGFDRFVIDGLVNATGIVADITGQLLKLFQTGYVRNYALAFLMGVVAILVYLATV
jgi:NADH-quinone oxidoreductase subunit L